MGNNISQALSSVSPLVKKRSPLQTSRRVTLDFDNDSLKLEIPFSGDGKDIMNNFTLPNDNYRNVVLSIGSALVDGTLNKDTNMWEFNGMFVPFFRLNKNECKFIVYPSPKTPQSTTDVDISYQTFECDKNDLVSCKNKTLQHGNILYTTDGHAI